jgi:MerR family redox-sensitive transcriptional activator SoxR
MVDKTHPLTIGELSRRSGVAPSALRYYEAQRLIFSLRTTGNQRRYERSTLRRVAFIRAAQRVGLSLEEITAALSTLPGGRTPSRSDWAQLSRDWRPRIEEQIARLVRLRDQLDGCIGCGCLSLETCSLQNPDDIMAARGPGAAFLEPAGS